MRFTPEEEDVIFSNAEALKRFGGTDDEVNNYLVSQREAKLADTMYSPVTARPSFTPDEEEYIFSRAEELQGLGLPAQDYLAKERVLKLTNPAHNPQFTVDDPTISNMIGQAREQQRIEGMSVMESLAAPVEEGLKGAARSVVNIPSMAEAARGNVLAGAEQYQTGVAEGAPEAPEFMRQPTDRQTELDAIENRIRLQIQDAVDQGMPQEIVGRLQSQLNEVLTQKGEIQQVQEAEATIQQADEQVAAQRQAEQYAADLAESREKQTELFEKGQDVAEVTGIGQDKYRRLDGVGGFAQDVAGVVTDVGAALALGTVNPALSTAYIAGKTTGGTYESLIKDGVAPEDAFTAVAVSAPVIIALEKAGLENVGQNILRQGLTKAIAEKGLTRIAQGAVAEGFTEALQTYPEFYAELWAKNQGLPDEERAQLTWEQFIDATKQASYAGLLGTIGGVGGSTIDVVVGKAQADRMRDAVREETGIQDDADIDEYIISGLEAGDPTAEVAPVAEPVAEVATEETVVTPDIAEQVTTTEEVTPDVATVPVDQGEVSTPEQASQQDWVPTEADKQEMANVVAERDRLLAELEQQEDVVEETAEQVVEDVAEEAVQEVVEEAEPEVVEEPAVEVERETVVEPEAVTETVTVQKEEAPGEAVVEEEVAPRVEPLTEEETNRRKTLTKRRDALRKKADNIRSVAAIPAQEGSQIERGLKPAQQKALDAIETRIGKIDEELRPLDSKARDVAAVKKQDIFVEEAGGQSAQTKQAVEMLPEVFRDVPVENVVQALDNEFTVEQVADAIADPTIDAPAARAIRDTWGSALMATPSGRVRTVAQDMNQELITPAIDEAGETPTFDDVVDEDVDTTFDFGANVEQEAEVTDDDILGGRDVMDAIMARRDGDVRYQRHKDAVKAMKDRVIANEKSMEIIHSNGAKQILTRSTQGGWQSTFIQPDGIPSGDRQWDSYADAINGMIEDGDVTAKEVSSANFGSELIGEQDVTTDTEIDDELGFYAAEAPTVEQVDPVREALAKVNTDKAVIEGTKKKNRKQVDKAVKLGKQWLSRLGVDADIVVGDIASTGAPVGKNVGGFNARVGDKYVVALSDRVLADEALATATMAHEIGHIVESEMINGADEATKKAIQGEYESWLSDMQRDGYTFRELVQSRAIPGAQKFIEGELGDVYFGNIDEYHTSKKEWMADQIGRFLVADVKPKGKVETFFGKIADKLRQLFKISKVEQAMPSATIEQWGLGLMDAARRNSKQSTTDQTVGFTPSVENLRYMKSYIHNHPSSYALDNFYNWFGQSHVVDEDGDPLVVYHGTTHIFKEFDATLGNVENSIGLGNYFSNSAYDVTENYSREDGPDLSGRISQRSDEIASMDMEEIVSFFGVSEEYANDIVEGDTDKSEALASRELIGDVSSGVVMPTYIRMTNPVYMSPRGDNNVTEFTGSIANEDGTLYDLYESLVEVVDDYVDFGFTGVQIADMVFENVEDSITAREFYNKLTTIPGVTYGTTYDGLRTSTGEMMRRVFDRLGFDGVVMNASEFFPTMEMDADAYHMITFNADQQKSATGNTGTFDPEVMSIEYMQSGEASKENTTDEGVAASEEALNMAAQGKYTASDLITLADHFQTLSEAKVQSVEGRTDISTSNMDKMISNTNALEEAFLKLVDQSYAEESAMFLEENIDPEQLVEAEKRGVMKERERQNALRKSAKEREKDKMAVLREYVEELDLRPEDKKKALDAASGYSKTKGVNGAVAELQQRFGALQGRATTLRMWKRLLKTHLTDQDLTGIDYLRAKDVLRKQTEGTEQEFKNLVEEIDTISERVNSIRNYKRSLIEYIADRKVSGTDRVRMMNAVANATTVDAVAQLEDRIITRADQLDRRAAKQRLNKIIRKVPKAIMYDARGEIEEIVNTYTGKGMRAKSLASINQLQEFIDSGRVDESELTSKTLRDLDRAMKVNATEQLDTEQLNEVADRLELLLNLNKMKTKLFKQAKEASKRKTLASIGEELRNSIRFQSGIDQFQKMKENQGRNVAKALQNVSDIAGWATMTGTSASNVETILLKLTGLDGTGTMHDVIYGFANDGYSNELRSQFVFEEFANSLKEEFDLGDLRDVSTIGYNFKGYVPGFFDRKDVKDATKRGLYRTLNLPSGAIFNDATVGDMMSVYLLSKNEDQMSALTRGEKQGSLVLGKHKNDQGEYQTITEEDVRFIISELGSIEDGKYTQVADRMGDFVNSYVREMINSTSQSIHGYDMAQVDNYWRLVKKDTYNDLYTDTTAKSERSEFNSNVKRSIEGAGILKERVNNAGGTLVIEDAFEVLADVFTTANQYNSYAQGLRMAKDAVNNIELPMRGANMDNEWKYLNDYLTGFENSLDNREQKKSPISAAFRFVKSQSTKAALAYGVTVQTKQWLSMPMASTEGLSTPRLLANWTAVTKGGTTIVHQNTDWGKKNVSSVIEQAKTHSPQLYARMTGRTSPLLIGGRANANVTQELYGVETKKITQVLPDIGMDLLRKRDSEVIAAIYYTSLESTNGDVEAAFKLAERVVRRTQPMNLYKDSDQLAQAARTNDLLSTVLTFTSPTRQYLNQFKRKFYEATYSGDWGKFARFVGKWYFINTILMAITDTIRDLIQGREVNAESVTKKLFNYGLSWSPIFRLGAPVVDYMLDQTMFYDPEQSGVQGGSATPYNSNLVSSYLVNVWKDFQHLTNEIQQESGVESNYRYNDDISRAVLDLSMEGAQLTGFPVKRVRQWANNVINWSDEVRDVPEYDATRARRLYNLGEQDLYSRKRRNSDAMIERGFPEEYVLNTKDWEMRFDEVEDEVELLFLTGLVDRLIADLYVDNIGLPKMWEDLTKDERRTVIKRAYNVAGNVVDDRWDRGRMPLDYQELSEE